MLFGRKKDTGGDKLLIGRILAKAVDAAEHAGPCPEPEQIAALMDGGLDGRERDTVLTHLAGCDDCRSVLETAVRLSAQEREAAPAGVPWLGRLAPLAAAAAVIALAVSAAVVYRGYNARTVRTEAVVAKADAPVKQLDESVDSPALKKEIGLSEPSAPPVDEAAPEPRREDRLDLALTDMPAPHADDDRMFNAPAEDYAGRYREPVAGAAEPRELPEPVEPRKTETRGETAPRAMAEAETAVPAPQEEPARMAQAAPAPAAAPQTFARTYGKGSGSGAEADSGGMATSRPSAGPECAVPAEGGPAICKPPPDKEDAAARTEAAGKDAVETVKATGTIASINPSKGEFVFVPEGKKDGLLVNAVESMLKGLAAGDKVMVIYEKSDVNVATRIKKTRAITVPVGC